MPGMLLPTGSDEDAGLAAAGDLAGSAAPLPDLLAANSWYSEWVNCYEAAVPRVYQGESVRCATNTPELARTLDAVVRMAPHDVTLLLVGETGTGKTTLARLVHELSTRREERFVTVACGALPRDLIESELFGHVKGAFTGADRAKCGKFEIASAGTLLLDEIDILGPSEQAKLLRVIESGEFEAVGSNDTQHSRARLIAAANVDLESLLERGEFRADLFYRLNVLQFRIPPLRERPDDIVPLALDFIAELSAAHQVSIRRIHPAFLEALKGYPWPGNLRELKNHLRRAVLFASSGELTMADLPPVVLASERRSEATPVARQPQTLSQRVASDEAQILLESLRAHNFRRTETAKALGISRVGLYKKMKRHGLLDRTKETCR